MSNQVPADAVTSGQHQHELDAVQLRFLGKHSAPGNSPTLWDTGRGHLVIRGFKRLSPDVKAQVGDDPEGEAVIWVPWELMRYLPKEHDAIPSPHPPDVAAA
jgi:hypothetical protein